MTSIQYQAYQTEEDLYPAIALIDADLSEPYSIYTYRYFVQQWPSLCTLAYEPDGSCVGVIICKLEEHRRRLGDNYFPLEKPALLRGYIGMVAVGKPWRGQGIGQALVRKALESMREKGAEEVVLEAETDNLGALMLYEKLGFVRDKRLFRYYMNGSDAYRLKLWL
ncbi:hypothetical protein GGF46_002445 [Coemansia sp. RSA 552]|nr:hypothetical protein GGF46_002445 [Coemansia sp. RSA 552]